MELIAAIMAAIIVAAQMALLFFEEKDRRNGVKVDHKDYTLTGMWKLILKERKEKRAAKKLEKAKKTSVEKNKP